MDGRNSFGRRISLLNEETPAVIRLPSLAPSFTSRTSSYSSSPCHSPPTPHLVRSNSSDSRMMETPSPVTPNFNGDDLFPSHGHPAIFPTDPALYGASTKDMQSAYPPLPHVTTSVAYPQGGGLSQNPYYQPSPSTTSASVSTEAPQPQTSSQSRPQTKKNHYPCPLAKQYNCSDHFTTSGHAARHAKKHTGKKDAFCPECNKAFTRKDNMEQHRRTHQTGRNASKTNGESSKKSKTASKKSKVAAPEVGQLIVPVDETYFPTSPASNFGPGYLQDESQPFQSEFLTSTQYPDPEYIAQAPTIMGGARYDMMSPQFSNALETLAIAASSEKRKFEN
ncbi:hypothetical protein M501DRAFT_1013807 [Patellaria atrata CBS 101060]|uniref:C2H2-type domain-containing protein n=1 Tax=Patellaria atrata CBS 101060 TaxID=1346257 RepID=A0A9P4SIK0_9PEZI|nr:hypothetical protein M501DRAFT_1013807 [Patellaria atrata CBS 101060]